jgi:hypothetical protein
VAVGVKALRILAVGGAGYLVSTDGTETETSPSVMYDRELGRIYPEAMAASQLKMLNGYSAPFTGSDEERREVEAEVAQLLDAPPACWRSARPRGALTRYRL